MPKVRLDVLLTERGLAGSRALAQRLIMAGSVRVNGQVVDKPGTPIGRPDEAEIQVAERPPYVSRGGEKLKAALDGFQIDVSGRVCADLGASTGGFTDCLLQAGAARVYAIDVGQGILDWSLRNDPRVVVMEGTNARYLESLPEPIDLATIDASFISLKLLLPVVKGWTSPPAAQPPPPSPAVQSRQERGEGAGGEVIALVKPQFEAGKKDVGKGGVVRDAAVHRRVLEEVAAAAQTEGFQLKGLIPSPLRGPKGNVEFLLWLSHPATEPSSPSDIEGMIDAALGAVAP